MAYRYCYLECNVIVCDILERKLNGFILNIYSTTGRWSRRSFIEAHEDAYFVCKEERVYNDEVHRPQ